MIFKNKSKERFEEDSTPTFLIQASVQKYLFATKHLKKNVVLDIACGIGYGIKIMYDKHQNVHFYGLDNNISAINFANKNYGDKAKFVLGDVYFTKFSDDFFDTIVSFETLEHLDKGEPFIKEIKRILKNDGILILSSPNKIFDERVSKDANPYHKKIYSSQELHDLLSKYFNQIQIFGQKETFSEIFYKLPFLYQIYRIVKPLLIPFFTQNKTLEIMNINKLNPTFEPKPLWKSAAYLIAIVSDY